MFARLDFHCACGKGRQRQRQSNGQNDASHRIPRCVRGKIGRTDQCTSPSNGSNEVRSIPQAVFQPDDILWPTEPMVSR
jgi:hypothetical protein